MHVHTLAASTIGWWELLLQHLPLHFRQDSGDASAGKSMGWGRDEGHLRTRGWGPSLYHWGWRLSSGDPK